MTPDEFIETHACMQWRDNRNGELAVKTIGWFPTVNVVDADEMPVAQVRLSGHVPLIVAAPALAAAAIRLLAITDEHGDHLAAEDAWGLFYYLTSPPDAFSGCPTLDWFHDHGWELVRRDELAALRAALPEGLRP